MIDYDYWGNEKTLMSRAQSHPEGIPFGMVTTEALSSAERNALALKTVGFRCARFAFLRGAKSEHPPVSRNGID